MKLMNAIPMRPVMMNEIPRPLRGLGERLGNVGVGEFLADGSDSHDGEEPADTGTEGIDCGVAEVGEVPFLHEEGGTHHGAVHCDKGQEDT